MKKIFRRIRSKSLVLTFLFLIFFLSITLANDPMYVHDLLVYPYLRMIENISPAYASFLLLCVCIRLLANVFFFIYCAVLLIHLPEITQWSNKKWQDVFLNKKYLFREISRWISVLLVFIILYYGIGVILAMYYSFIYFCILRALQFLKIVSFVDLIAQYLVTFTFVCIVALAFNLSDVWSIWQYTYNIMLLGVSIGLVCSLFERIFFNLKRLRYF